MIEILMVIMIIMMITSIKVMIRTTIAMIKLMIIITGNNIDNSVDNNSFLVITVV